MSIFLIVLSGLSFNQNDDCSLLNLDNHFKLNIPHLRKLGLFKCAGLSEEFLQADASYGAINTNKDNVIKQIAQMVDDESNEEFDTFSSEIPESVMEKIKQIFHAKPLYGKRGDFQSAIKECGSSAKNYCCPIVYTKENESVLKIAVHEKCYKEKDFFELVEIVSKELEKYNIQTVEGKIFAGELDFYKTQHNKVFKKVSCDSKLLQSLKNKGVKCVGVGKIEDFINASCFDENYISKTDGLSLKTLEKLVLRKDNLFAFAYLTDYEKIHASHGDLLGARVCLEAIDDCISHIVKHLKKDDLLIITSTYNGDNNEKVPLLIYAQDNKENASNLGEFEGYKVINDTIKQHINL